MADELAAALGGLLGGRVAALQQLSGGASRETWSFDLTRSVGGAVEPLILQRERPGGMRKAGMATEAALLRAAAGQGVPVPEVMATDADAGDTALGPSFMVVVRLEGETIPRRILRDAAYRDMRLGLAAQCGEALAGIHAIQPSAAPALVGDDQLAQYREVLDALGEPHPAFELGFRWLSANRPHAGDVGDVGVVHGDFRNGNLLVGPDGLRAVLDWELAHLGDPLEDLAWLCVKAWRFGSSPRVGGFGTVEALVSAYELATGTFVDLDELHWWEVLGTLKWGIMCVVQAAAHLSGASRSVELAAIGRRVCEQEHDLLLLLP